MEKKFFRPFFLKNFIKGFWIINTLFLLAAALKPADNQISLYKKIYSTYEEPITLFYTEGNNPYHRMLNISYYKRKNLNIEKINSLGEISVPVNGKCLFVTKDKTIASSIKNEKKLIYSTFPDWVKKFNINNWLDRTNIWYVYELY